MPDLSIIVPTLNESGNIRPLIEMIKTSMDGMTWEIVFVDDRSTDKTRETVKDIARRDRRVRLISRDGRRGLTGACSVGILSSYAQFCAVMDADLQHDPSILPIMLAQLRGDATLDIVIGTRPTDAPRRPSSRLGSSLVKRFLGISVTDPMSGYFMVRRTSFELAAQSLRPSGTKILVDFLSSPRCRWRVGEIPYVFGRRKAGRSKFGPLVWVHFLTLIVVRSLNPHTRQETQNA